MELKQSLCILAFLLICLKSVYALQCYVCHPESGGGKDCSDSRNFEPFTCTGGEKSCLKIVLDNEITRACALKGEEGCKGSGSNVHCNCSGDLCNSAVNINPMKTTYWISMLLALLVASLVN